MIADVGIMTLFFADQICLWAALDSFDILISITLLNQHFLVASPGLPVPSPKKI